MEQLIYAVELTAAYRIDMNAWSKLSNDEIGYDQVDWLIRWHGSLHDHLNDLRRA